MVEIPLELTQKCVKCALCKSVCPTYPYIQEEAGYARGRIVLAEMLLSGELKDGEAYKHLDQCAMCRRCEWVCPNGVEYKEIIATVRNTQRKSFVKSAGLKAWSFAVGSRAKGNQANGQAHGKVALEEVKVPFPTGAVKFMPKPDVKAFSLRGKPLRLNRKKVCFCSLRAV